MAISRFNFLESLLDKTSVAWFKYDTLLCYSLA